MSVSNHEPPGPLATTISQQGEGRREVHGFLDSVGHRQAWTAALDSLITLSIPLGAVLVIGRMLQAAGVPVLFGLLPTGAVVALVAWRLIRAGRTATNRSDARRDFLAARVDHNAQLRELLQSCHRLTGDGQPADETAGAFRALLAHRAALCTRRLDARALFPLPSRQRFATLMTALVAGSVAWMLPARAPSSQLPVTVLELPGAPGGPEGLETQGVTGRALDSLEDLPELDPELAALLDELPSRSAGDLTGESRVTLGDATGEIPESESAQDGEDGSADPLDSETGEESAGEDDGLLEELRRDLEEALEELRQDGEEALEQAAEERKSGEETPGRDSMGDSSERNQDDSAQSTERSQVSEGDEAQQLKQASESAAAEATLGAGAQMGGEPQQPREGDDPSSVGDATGPQAGEASVFADLPVPLLDAMIALEQNLLDVTASSGESEPEPREQASPRQQARIDYLDTVRRVARSREQDQPSGSKHTVTPHPVPAGHRGSVSRYFAPDEEESPSNPQEDGP